MSSRHHAAVPAGSHKMLYVSSGAMHDTRDLDFAPPSRTFQDRQMPREQLSGRYTAHSSSRGLDSGISSSSRAPVRYAPNPPDWSPRAPLPYTSSHPASGFPGEVGDYARNDRSYSIRNDRTTMPRNVVTQFDDDDDDDESWSQTTRRAITSGPSPVSRRFPSPPQERNYHRIPDEEEPVGRYRLESKSRPEYRSTKMDDQLSSAIQYMNARGTRVQMSSGV